MIATKVVGDEIEYVDGGGWISDDSDYYGKSAFRTDGLHNRRASPHRRADLSASISMHLMRRAMFPAGWHHHIIHEPSPEVY